MEKKKQFSEILEVEMIGLGIELAVGRLREQEDSRRTLRFLACTMGS